MWSVVMPNADDKVTIVFDLKDLSFLDATKEVRRGVVVSALRGGQLNLHVCGDGAFLSSAVGIPQELTDPPVAALASQDGEEFYCQCPYLVQLHNELD